MADAEKRVLATHYIWFGVLHANGSTISCTDSMRPPATATTTANARQLRVLVCGVGHVHNVIEPMVRANVLLAYLNVVHSQLGQPVFGRLFPHDCFCAFFRHDFRSVQWPMVVVAPGCLFDVFPKQALVGRVAWSMPLCCGS